MTASHNGDDNDDDDDDAGDDGEGVNDTEPAAIATVEPPQESRSACEETKPANGDDAVASGGGSDGSGGADAEPDGAAVAGSAALGASTSGSSSRSGGDGDGGGGTDRGGGDRDEVSNGLDEKPVTSGSNEGVLAEAAGVPQTEAAAAGAQGRIEGGAGPERRSWLQVGSVLGTDNLYLRNAAYLIGKT